MKLNDEQLRQISAGATAVDYGSLLTKLIAFIQKVVAYIQNLLNPAPPPSDGGGGSGGSGGDGGGGGGHGSGAP